MTSNCKAQTPGYFLRTKVGKNKLKMKDGTVKVFKSEKARDNYEKVAAAYSHGWKGGK
jgi:hypothetical protein